MVSKYLKRVLKPVIIGLLIGIEMMYGMSALPTEVIWRIVKEVAHESKTIGAVKVKLCIRYMCVSSTWKKLIEDNVREFIEICSQDEKNYFLLRAVGSLITQNMRDQLCKAGALIHGLIEKSRLIPIYDIPGGPVLEYSRDISQTSPWFSAVDLGSIDDIKYFIKQSALVDTSENKTGQTALMKACQSGLMELIELLLQHGASTTLTCVQRKTAYDYAKSQEVKELLNRYQKERQCLMNTDFSSSDDDNSEEERTLYERAVCDESQIYAYVVNTFENGELELMFRGNNQNFIAQCDSQRLR